MVQLKADDADRFLSRPDPRYRVVLLYGSDGGLIAERAGAMTRAVAGDEPLNVVRLDSAAVAADPARLADEANALAMFGGDRLVIVSVEGNRPIHKQVAALLDHPPDAAWVVLAAGELRRGTGLRGLCEKHPAAAAIACYPDAGRQLDRVIDEEMQRAGLAIDDDARDLLRSLLGDDRRINRSELEKLALFASTGDGGKVEIAHVQAVVGDTAAFAIDAIVDAMALGNVDAMDRDYRRLVASGTPGVVVATAAQRHFNFLHRTRAACDAGASADDAIARARPPIFYQRRGKVRRQLDLWSRARLESGLAILDATVLDSRLNGAIADTVIARALLRIAVATGGAARRQN